MWLKGQSNCLTAHGLEFHQLYHQKIKREKRKDTFLMIWERQDLQNHYTWWCLLGAGWAGARATGGKVCVWLHLQLGLRLDILWVEHLLLVLSAPAGRIVSGLPLKSPHHASSTEILCVLCPLCSHGWAEGCICFICKWRYVQGPPLENIGPVCILSSYLNCFSFSFFL